MLSRSLPVVFLLTSSVAYAADAPVSFSKDVAPIFQKSCWKCHGGAVQLSHLDLRTRESALKGGDHGPALMPGNPAQSRLYRLVSGQEKPRMPMDRQLTPEELRILESWINQGAAWENVTPRESGANALAATEEMPLPADARQFWAFRQPVRPPVPQNGASHPIDAFLLQAMEAKGLKPGPKADRRTLLRRAFLDLTGLPPTPSEAAQFLQDQAPGAWERLIDRLLASPHYGERWGRYWLDVARYADSNGFEHDFDRPNAWRYRDYVIRSYNEDKPYSRFLQEQIAGDELDQTTNETRIATGFLRSYAKVGFREKDNPQYRYEYLDDMIATIGRGVLGLTIQCARCHNHKFDPIAQKDYYSLQASLFGYVEVDQPLVPPAEAARYQQRMAEIDARIQPLRRRIREIEEPYRKALLPAKYKQFPANVQEAIATPEERRTPGQVLLANQIIRTVSVSSSEIDTVITPADRAERQRLQGQIRAIERERPAPIPMAMAVTDGDYRFAPDGPGDEPAPGKGVKHEAIEGSFLWNGHGRYQAPPSYFLYHGDIESHGSRMQPGFVKVITYGNPPAALPPADGHTSGRRRALAEWLTSRENPLTARVEVNRIWLHHFGRGIVATADNFGKMGDRPTHPELLDWLAVEFMERGWSLRQMHRLIMTSEAYQRSSQFGEPADLAKDPDNLYLWRFRIQRLDAETLRDSILAVSGGLNPQMFGRPIFPPLQQEILASMNKGIWETRADGPEVWRRSVYVYRKRGLPFPFFEVFDLPDQNLSCSRRDASTVPTQALTLLNDEFVLKQAELLAGRVAEAAPSDPEKQIEAAYQIALNRPPRPEERSVAQSFLSRHKLVDLTHVLLNLNEFLYLR